MSTTYKIRSFTTGTSRAGTPYTNHSLTVPARIAEVIANDALFTCEMTGAGILFRPAPAFATELPAWARPETLDPPSAVTPSVADALRGLTGEQLATQVAFTDDVVDAHRRGHRIPDATAAREDLRRMLALARVVDRAPQWGEEPRDGAALLQVGDWLTLVVVRPASGLDAPFLAIARRGRDRRQVRVADPLCGWALARMYGGVPTVRERVGGDDAWHALRAVVAANGTVDHRRPAWCPDDRDGDLWLTARTPTTELAFCLRESRYEDGPPYTAVCVETRPLASGEVAA